MSWFSILPSGVSFIEAWAIRIFLLLGILVIAPWLILLAYDLLFFIFHVVTYEVPYVGGRARHRPRPSLSERSSGRLRALSLSVPGVPTSTDMAGLAGLAGDTTESRSFEKQD